MDVVGYKTRWSRLVLLVMMMALFFSLTACSEKKDDITLETFKTAFKDAGVTLEKEGTPYFQLIKAKNGLIFYNETNVVKIYEYKDKATLKKAVKEYDMMSDWPQNGRFVLESHDEQAIEIFMRVKSK